MGWAELSRFPQRVLCGLAAGLLTQVWAADSGALAPAATSFSRARARVVVVEGTGATEAFAPTLPRVQQLFDLGLTNLAGTATTTDAWAKYVAPTDVVGVKVLAQPGPLSGTRPAVVEALVRSLLATGHPATNIVIWDKHREDLRRAGYVALASRLGVDVEGAVQAGYDPAVFYENSIPGELVWGDLEYQPGGEAMGQKSHVTRLLTSRITRIINVPPLLNHNLLGVSGTLFSLSLASVDNTRRFAEDLDRLAVAVPEIYALPDVGDRVAFSVVDALVAQYRGERDSLLHYATPLNQLRFSTDPVALDVLSIAELAAQRRGKEPQEIPVSPAPYLNAELLELGISKPDAIRKDLIHLPPGVSP